MEYYPDSIFTVRPKRVRSFSFLFNHKGTMPPALDLARGLLDQATANKGGGTDMMRTVQKLLVAFILGAISYSLTASMAKAQVRERVKVEPKRKPTPQKKGKDGSVERGKVARNSTEDPKNGESHKDGSSPNTNRPQDSCVMTHKNDPSAQLKCEERKRNSIPKGKATRPPGLGS